MNVQEQEDIDFEAGAEDQELRAMRDEAIRDAALWWASDEAEAQRDWEDDCERTRAAVLDPHGEALAEGRARDQAQEAQERTRDQARKSQEKAEQDQTDIPF